jgi:hypothetical protein
MAVSAVSCWCVLAACTARSPCVSIAPSRRASITRTFPSAADTAAYHHPSMLSVNWLFPYPQINKPSMSQPQLHRTVSDTNI